MSRHAERLKSVRSYEDERASGRPALAIWGDASDLGGCNACHWRGRVAKIEAGGFALRLCARCLNNVNANLGGLR